MTRRFHCFILLLLLPQPYFCKAETKDAGNLTSTEVLERDVYVGYVQDPSGRGTGSLILSCFLTLVLCVWSALHLNVPRKHESLVTRFGVNLRWIIVGIYAPELVVFTAWRQWSSATILTDEVGRSLKFDRYSKDEACSLPEWTQVHSFFACAGGFAFELDTLRGLLGDAGKDECLDQPTSRLYLTARGVRLLALCGRLPRVTREEINDKSKANALAKATVIVQAGWMLLQVLGRLCVQLPVTLLEVNTVAHVLCAFIMYLCWWNKPLVPNEPILIKDEKLAALAAFMYVSSGASGYVDPEKFKSQTFIKTLFAHLQLYSKTPELELLALQTPFAHVGQAYSNQASTERPRLPKPLVEVAKAQTLKPASQYLVEISLLKQLKFAVRRAPQHPCLNNLHAKREKDTGTAFFERRPRVLCERSQSEKVTTSDQKRWQLLMEALQEYNFVFEDRVILDHVVGDTYCVHLKPDQLVAEHIQNWPGDDLLRNVDGLVVGMVLWLANFCYGGIHAAAWNDHFPSEFEKWMWRVSACYIGFCGGLWVVLNFIVAKHRRLNEFWERWMDGEKPWWQSLTLGCLVFVCGAGLVVARAYIVIEAFLSIRQLPVLAYQTPQWTDIFPHF